MATWVNILDVLYPVGAVYFSTASTSPASTVGGSWTQIKGAVIAAYGSNGYTLKNYGGSLALTNNHLPANMGSTQMRALMGTTDMFINGSSGIIELSMETWEGDHAGVQNIIVADGKLQNFKLQGGGQIFSPDTLEYIFGIGLHKAGDLVWQLL